MAQSRRSRYESTGKGVPGVEHEEPAFWIDMFGWLTLPHIANLMEVSYEKAQDITRSGKDAGLWKAHQTMARGSGPDLLTLTAKGRRLIPDSREYSAPEKQWQHGVLTRNTLVWAIRVAKMYGWEWKIQTHKLSHQGIEPDGAFWWTFPDGKKLCCLIEADTGSERGNEATNYRWKRKCAKYSPLMRESLTDWLGVEVARILVVCTTEARVQNLAELIQKMDPETLTRYWLTDKKTVEIRDAFLPLWLHNGDWESLVPSFLKPS